MSRTDSDTLRSLEITAMHAPPAPHRFDEEIVKKMQHVVKLLQS
jgi:hypothetical protein